ncbi:MAG: pentapeptide repeat-containing protein [Phycisphaerales bacterium JB038]
MADAEKNEAPISREEAIAMLRVGKVEEWNTLRETHPEWEPDLSSVHQPADLSERILTGVNLSAADLDGADLRGATLSEANLAKAQLSHSKLCGTRLRSADLRDASLYKADLSRSVALLADLRGAFLHEVDLSEATLVGADLSGATLAVSRLVGSKLGGANLSGTAMFGSDLSNADVTGVLYSRAKMRGKCRGIRVSTCYGDALFKRDAEDQDFIDTLEQHWMRSWEKHKIREAWRPAWLFIWRYGTDYGRGILRVAISALLLAALFGLVFLICDRVGHPLLHYHPETPDTWVTPFYYSVVTYTTLGFGDVIPGTVTGQVIVMLEVILGYITLGLLISILANKVARRA